MCYSDLQLNRLGTGDLSQVAKQATQALMSGGTAKNGPMSGNILLGLSDYVQVQCI